MIELRLKIKYVGCFVCRGLGLKGFETGFRMIGCGWGVGCGGGCRRCW